MIEDEIYTGPSRITKRSSKSQKGNGLFSFNDVVRVPIEWLWKPYIPLGRVSMLGGDPGAGKSFITSAIASTLSRGESLPGEKEGIRAPTGTLLLSVEDDPGDTIRPRLESLNTNMSFVFGSNKDIELGDNGIETIRGLVKETGVKLVIIDPIVAFLGNKMDMNRANDVRGIMRGLSQLARELKIAILVVRHNRKEGNSGQGKAIYAGMGSIDFTASVRSEMAVVEAKNGVKFMNHIKANSGKKGPSITYSITSNDIDEPVFAWGEFTKWPVSGALGSSGSKISRKPREATKAITWLLDILKDYPDGIPANEVFERGKLARFSTPMLNEAKKGIVRSVRVNNMWYWKLDRTAKLDPDDPPVLG